MGRTAEGRENTRFHRLPLWFGGIPAGDALYSGHDQIQGCGHTSSHAASGAGSGRCESGLDWNGGGGEVPEIVKAETYGCIFCAEGVAEIGNS